LAHADQPYWDRAETTLENFAQYVSREQIKNKEKK